VLWHTQPASQTWYATQLKVALGSAVVVTNGRLIWDYNPADAGQTSGSLSCDAFDKLPVTLQHMCVWKAHKAVVCSHR